MERYRQGQAAQVVHPQHRAENNRCGGQWSDRHDGVEERRQEREDDANIHSPQRQEYQLAAGVIPQPIHPPPPCHPSV